jgi:hypothetical protein
MATNTASILLRIRTTRDAEARMDADCQAFCDAAPLRLQLERVACASASALAYVYLQPAHEIAAADLPSLAEAFAQHCHWAGEVLASRLEPVFDVAGASADEPAIFHYVVEMDPEPGWMPELTRWYDTEHMPGLAAVPGCIRARRFLNQGHGPLSLACYDLVSEETLGSPPWLAVRGTAWSTIVRPHFMNTRRSMFRVPPPAS